MLEPSCEARAREFSYSDDAALDSLVKVAMAIYSTLGDSYAN